MAYHNRLEDDDTVWIEYKSIQYKVATMRDFVDARDMMFKDDGWTMYYSGKRAKVFFRSLPSTEVGFSMTMYRVCACFPGLEPRIVYDMLHDADYRKEWDKYMIEGRNLTRLDDRNDIGFYSVKCPFPLARRDFVNSRSWAEFDTNDFIIFNTSVKATEMPPVKGFVRGISFVGGYYMRPDGEGGTNFYYFTHADMRGAIPKMVINYATSKIVPGVIKNLEQTAHAYPAWAAKQYTDPDYVPYWRTEQLSWPDKMPTPTVGEAMRKLSKKELKKQQKEEMKQNAKKDRNYETEECVTEPTR